MFTATVLVTTYSGGRVRLATITIDRQLMEEALNRVYVIIVSHLRLLANPDSGSRVVFDVRVRERTDAVQGDALGERKEDVLDILGEVKPDFHDRPTLKLTDE